MGTILSLPVVVAVIAADLVGTTWVLGPLMNHWVPLAHIAPVVLYAGWPIHRTGYLALAMEIARSPMLT